MLWYLVTQHTSELGICIAFGPQRQQILRLVLVKGLRPSWIGLFLGITGGAGAAQLIRSMLHGVQPLDTSVFVAVTLLLSLVGGAACIVPAWHASHLDPMEALRQD